MYPHERSLVKRLEGKPFVLLGINSDDSVGVWLKQRLIAAKVRESPDYTLRDAVNWLRNGDVVAFAGGRQRLMSGTRDAPRLRMLDDNFYGVPQTIAIPLDHPDRVQRDVSGWASGLKAGGGSGSRALPSCLGVTAARASARAASRTFR